MQVRAFAALGVTAVCVCVAAVAAQDPPAALNIKPDQARGFVRQAMQEGRIGWDGYEWPFKKASGDARIALIDAVAGWARAYTESEAFGTQYASERKRLEPRPPRPRLSADEQLARQKSDLDGRIAAERRRLDAPPPRNVAPDQAEKIRAAAQERLKDLVARRARFDDPQAVSEMRSGIDGPAAAEKAKYESDRAKWEERYPADFHTLIAGRLRSFLAETADVDFSAALGPCAGRAGSRGNRCFVNPKYENKTREWKLCYRAGKPALDAARTFASKWLADLEKGTRD